MGYKEDNARKIEDAFARFRANAEAEFRNGLEAVLDAGVKLCLDHHHDIDAEHPKPHLRHVEQGGYGWILIHDGVEVNRKVYGENAKLVSKANAHLSNVVERAKTGWVGVVLASLEPVKYFNVLYEFIPMRAAIRDLKTEDFNRYFKPMAV